MRAINKYSHIPYLEDELWRLLRPNSFAFWLARRIGIEIDLAFHNEAENGDFSSFANPVQSLFDWISYDGGLPTQWLQNDADEYISDRGDALPPEVEPTLSDVDQVVAFGLFLIRDIDSCGGSYSTIDNRSCEPDDNYEDGGFNQNGWTQPEVINHRAECLLLAYQALSYAQRLSANRERTASEKERAAKIDFASLGRAGAERRHAPMRNLERWVLGKYKEGNWPSANRAAHALKDEAIRYGNTINARLIPENAQRTIAEWINKSKKATV